MSDPRHKVISRLRHRDLEPTKRIGFPANSSVLTVYYTVVRHAVYTTVVGHTITAGGCGAAHRKHRQHRYYDSDNHPLDTHDGLPDIGPESNGIKMPNAP